MFRLARRNPWRAALVCSHELDRSVSIFVRARCSARRQWGDVLESVCVWRRQPSNGWSLNPIGPSLASRIEAVASRPTHVAVLLDKDQRPMMTADLDIADGRLVLRLNLTPPRDFTANVLEVWLVSPDGARRSLGVFPSERPGTTTALVLPHDTAVALAKAALAVSLEPRGGSRTGQPSGPVLFTGALVPVAL